MHYNTYDLSCRVIIVAVLALGLYPSNLLCEGTAKP